MQFARSAPVQPRQRRTNWLERGVQRNDSRTLPANRYSSKTIQINLRRYLANRARRASPPIQRVLFSRIGRGIHMEGIVGDCQRGEFAVKMKGANLGLRRPNVYAQQ